MEDKDNIIDLEMGGTEETEETEETAIILADVYFRRDT